MQVRLDIYRTVSSTHIFIVRPQVVEVGGPEPGRGRFMHHISETQSINSVLYRYDDIGSH